MTPELRHLTISNADDASAPGCESINRWLREHNWASNPDFMASIQEQEAAPLVLIARSGGKLVGGLIGHTRLAWLHISVMAVDPENRSRGIGAALLAEAERQAFSRGCRHAYVDTMEYQAPAFYQKHGFTLAGELPDWDSHGHSKFHFFKHLGDSRSV